ncbi:MAG: hypothetical protein JW783_02455 [Bacteroidales bacterium]|nr:hypothetical protein [Bacteroidales bacterium]MBN2749821.1 hypothetical protein [Bacteroidales bacterium]
MWQHLVEVALLGTEKRLLDTTILPPSIKDCIGESAFDAEQSFLQTAALACYYTEAGKEPLKVEHAVNEEIILETLDTAPAVYKEIFGQIDGTNSRIKEKLLSLWLDALIERNLTVEPEGIVPLLSTGNSLSEVTKSKIVKVIGNKGNWLLQFQFDFRYNNSPGTDDTIWLEGTPAERREFLSKSLRNNAEHALSLLKSTWDQESLVSKRGYLDLLKEVLHPSAIQFALDLYTTEFAYRTKEKKTEKECRKVLSEILLSSTETELYQKSIEHLSSYFSFEKKKGLLGIVSKSQTDYLLPDEGDSAFWNAENMEQTYGFEVKNYDISRFGNISQYWLSCFIECIPLESWLNEQVATYPALITCFLANNRFNVNIQGKPHSVLFDSFIQSIITQRNGQMASALVPRIPVTAAIPMLQLLSKDEYEQFVQKNKLFSDYEVLANGPYNLNESWSESFSTYILSSIFDIAIQSNTINTNALGVVLAQYLNTNTAGLLQKINEKAAESNLYYLWNANIYEPVNSVLQIRKSIKNLKS